LKNHTIHIRFIKTINKNSPRVIFENSIEPPDIRKNTFDIEIEKYFKNDIHDSY